MAKKKHTDSAHLLKRFDAFATNWLAIPHQPFNPRSKKSQATALKLLKDDIWSAFRDTFAPIAVDAAIALGLGTTHVIDVLSLKHQGDWLPTATGTQDVVVGAERIIATGAVILDPARFNRSPFAVANHIEPWVQGSFWCGENNTVRPVCQWLDYVHHRLELIKPKKATRGGGRKPVHDKHEDQRRYDSWRTGQHRSLKDCANALGISVKELRRSLDRHRKR